MQSCSAYGAPLATIHNAAEDALVKALTSSAADDCFIGLRKYKTLAAQRGWLWIDRQVPLGATEADYLNWGPEWKSIWKLLPPGEHCGTYQAQGDGWGNRPCYGVKSKLPCFVCATIDPSASDGAQLAYANNFQPDEWWIPPQASNPSGPTDWEGITGDGNSNSIIEDWVVGGEDIDIGASGDGTGIDIPGWNSPVDPSLIPTTTTTVTIPPVATPPATTTAVTVPVTTSPAPTTTTVTTTAIPTTTSTTILPTTTTTTLPPTTSTTLTTTTTTTTTATTTTTTLKVQAPPVTVQQAEAETSSSSTLPTTTTSTEIVKEGGMQNIEIEEPGRVIGKGDSGNIIVVGIAVGISLLILLVGTTVGVVVYRHHKRDPIETSTDGGVTSTDDTPAPTSNADIESSGG